MYFSRLILKNWRNFKVLDTPLEPRTFFVGPNASGKSNLLDAFHFFHDVARSGGLRKAVLERGGPDSLGSLSTRGKPEIELGVEVRGTRGPVWGYGLTLARLGKKGRAPLLAAERVERDGKCLLQRPNADDRKDPRLLEQTHLEQVSRNHGFRDLVDLMGSVLQPQLSPQLVRLPVTDTSEPWQHDPFGFSLFHRIATTPDRLRKARLRKIEEALRFAVPEFKSLREGRDLSGGSRLEAVFESWMPRSGVLGEGEFSEGTLRLIALLWALLSGDGPLLLEEPELSLHPAVAARLAPLLWRVRAGRQRQILISTHSADLLSDPGIGAEEIILLKPSGMSGTDTIRATDLEDVELLLEGGMNLAEAVLPKTVPEKASRLAFPIAHDSAAPASRR